VHEVRRAVQRRGVGARALHHVGVRGERRDDAVHPRAPRATVDAARHTWRLHCRRYCV
jgi:hypothetical protein